MAAGVLLLVHLASCGAFAAGAPAVEGPAVTISGRVTDFSGVPLEGADVVFLSRGFAELAATTTGPNGRYSLEVDRGARGHLIACRDYREKNLEFWAWNIEANGDLTIDARVHRLELYAMNAFAPQGGTPSWFVYIRPMSLTKAIEFMTADAHRGPVADIAPEIDPEEVSAAVDGVETPVLEMSRVLEAGGKDTGGLPLVAYLIQIAAPDGDLGTGTRRICVELRDAELEESGEGCVFWAPPAHRPPG
jgi:hypothetical protein